MRLEPLTRNTRYRMNLPINEIKTGYIGLVYVPFNAMDPDTWISPPTRLVLGSRFSHAVLFLIEEGLLYIVEALPFKRVRKVLYSEWVQQFPREVVVIKRECPAENITCEIGKKYDLAAAVWSHICYRLSRKWNGHTGGHADRKRFCFELVMKAHNMDNYWMGHPDLIKE